MKQTGQTTKKILLSLLVLSVLGLTGCGENKSSTNNTESNTGVVSYYDLAECNAQTLPIGIPGNTACPYKGLYDSENGYQAYSIQYSASIGVGFYIDFGWHYEDMCPQVGQLPIFQNGSFSHCSSVNPVFAQTDFVGFTQPNTGECTGDQYNMEITGCRPSLQPSTPLYNW